MYIYRYVVFLVDIGKILVHAHDGRLLGSSNVRVFIPYSRY